MLFRLRFDAEGYKPDFRKVYSPEKLAGEVKRILDTYPTMPLRIVATDKRGKVVYQHERK